MLLYMPQLVGCMADSMHKMRISIYANMHIPKSAKMGYVSPLFATTHLPENLGDYNIQMELM